MFWGEGAAGLFVFAGLSVLVVQYTFSLVTIKWLCPPTLSVPCLWKVSMLRPQIGAFQRESRSTWGLAVGTHHPPPDHDL